MKIEYPYNSWTPVVFEDVRTFTDDDIQKLGVALAEEIMILFRGQKLTPQDEVNFGSRFGTLENKAIVNARNRKAICLPGMNGLISRVTGQLNEDGMPGIHGGVSALDWHCNRAWDKNRDPIVYLYSLEGSKGSRTSWGNYVKAYEELPQLWKDRLANLKVKTAQTYSKYSEMGKYFGAPDKPSNWSVNIITKNPAGKNVIFFPWNQMEGIADVSPEEEKEITEFLTNYLLQEKFIYHHDWEDGDIIIADQWSGMHKRWEFEKMAERILHRMAFNYDKIRFSSTVNS
jgi:alpha-ketoglutarate-dependent taurine dioxygenase